VANWTGDATVLAVDVGAATACGWGTAPGDVRKGVDWQITIAGESVSADEDMRNWPTDDVPYTGTLSGRTFTATYSNGPDYLKYVCQLRGGTLTGTFDPEFSTFEAAETLTWGPPGSETTVHRRWVGSRR
jgi:hypothetical protein